MGCLPRNQTKSAKKDNRESRLTNLGYTLGKNSLRISASWFIGKRPGAVEDFYTIGETLGSGSYGSVRFATHKLTGQRRAIKTIEKRHIISDSSVDLKFFAEVDILRVLDHPNIVKLFEFFEDTSHFHLVTEFVEGGQFFHYISKHPALPESTAAHFMSQLLSAVACCHANNIVHRDLKPENLLMDRYAPDAALKIIDFGTSAIHKSSDPLTRRFGTSYYIAPEVLYQEYDAKCDLWSCGVIMYMMLSGKPPFDGKEEKKILENIYLGAYSMKGGVWDHISSEAKTLIAKLLSYDSETRISAHEALQDKWILMAHQHAISSTAMENLQQFKADQSFQHTVLTFISSQILSEKDNLEETFKNLDYNHDGKISKEELILGLNNVWGVDLGTHVAEEIMERVDVDQSGFIDYTEFIMGSVPKQTLLSNANLNSAFSAFDFNGNGRITVDELKVVLGGLDEIVNDQICENLIREADINGDGEVDFDEFKFIMYKL